ncbi:uncharacterized protein LOC125671290 [Ostrea edulis]|uniref:uncharacterized protein LOC125671290 n=1 Tax=Ostrea edulis TaxID=37623 RepID=UPI002094AD2D|nr:uncharacterized protein LOC125671290 [Ostrea edulis]
MSAMLLQAYPDLLYKYANCGNINTVRSMAKDMGSLPTAVWDTQSLTLRDVLMQVDVPTLGKIVKGQFMNLGVSKIPFRNLQQEVLIHSIKTNIKVLSHSVQRIDGRDGRLRLQSLEQRLSIPITYQGWFELLSEDGRSARPIDSVMNLAKVRPTRCLVRQNIKAFMSSEDGQMTYDKSKIVPAGESLTLMNDVAVKAPTGERRKVLKCRDSKGVILFLDFEQRGLFTPIAGPQDVAGVMTIKDIIGRFRLPLTVKLVQGVWPKVDSNRFTGVIRLDWVYTDEVAFLCPLDRGMFRITPVPTEVLMKVLPATNSVEILENQTIKDIITKVNRMVANYNNTIHLILAVPEAAMVKNKSHQMVNMFSPKENVNGHSRVKRSKSREDFLMDDVDELYQYLRDGKMPPKDKFHYDSDEESFFEEPAYEKLDDFRSRLERLERGEPGNQSSRYRPADLAKLGLHKGTENLKTVGGINEIKPKSPPDAPPPVPPRRYTRADSAPVIPLSQVQKLSPQKTGSSSGSSRGGASKKGTKQTDSKSSSHSSGKRHSVHTFYL